MRPVGAVAAGFARDVGGRCRRRFAAATNARTTAATAGTTGCRLAPPHDLDCDRAIGVPGRDARRRERQRRFALDGGNDVELDDEQLVAGVEARGAHAGELPELELEVVENEVAHRASFAS
jgi:hypothetical protein